MAFLMLIVCGLGVKVGGQLLFRRLICQSSAVFAIP